MTPAEKWIALMLAVAIKHGLCPYVAADLLHEMVSATSDDRLYATAYNAALAARGALR